MGKLKQLISFVYTHLHMCSLSTVSLVIILTQSVFNRKRIIITDNCDTDINSVVMIMSTISPHENIRL